MGEEKDVRPHFEPPRPQAAIKSRVILVHVHMSGEMAVLSLALLMRDRRKRRDISPRYHPNICCI
jgi:hypothetical protein